MTRRERSTLSGPSSFQLGATEVLVPVPDGWTSTRTRTTLTLLGREPGTAPVPVASVTITDGANRAVLGAQVEHASIALTDFVVLHLGNRETRSENWLEIEPDPRFVFGTYRQGIWTIAAHVGILASDRDQRCALFTAMCGFEDLVGLDPIFEGLVSGTEVRW